MEKPTEGQSHLSQTGDHPNGSHAPVTKKSRPRRKKRKSAPPKEAQKRVSRNFPASSFEEALEFAKAIFRIGSGNPVRRLTLFNELGKSPESSASRQIITNASKYGLVTGSYKAEQLELTGWIARNRRGRTKPGARQGTN
jgi:hypothetical protein